GHSYSIFTTDGYPFFLLAAHKLVGIGYLPPIQAALMLGAYFASVYLLLSTRRTLQIFLAPPLVLGPLFFSFYLEYSFQILTESAFLAAMTLGGAALASSTQIPSHRNLAVT